MQTFQVRGRKSSPEVKRFNNQGNELFGHTEGALNKTFEKKGKPGKSKAHFALTNEWFIFLSVFPIFNC